MQDVLGLQNTSHSYASCVLYTFCGVVLEVHALLYLCNRDRCVSCYCSDDRNLIGRNLIRRKQGTRSGRITSALEFLVVLNRNRG